MADKQKFKCLGECGKEFEFGQWECFAGQAHKVDPKTYYLADAPHVDVKNDPDGLALRTARTMLHCVPEELRRDPTTGMDNKIAHPPCIFSMGQYTTDNPKEQFFIERSKHTVSYEKWFNAYHTPKMKANIKEGQLLDRERTIAAKEAEVERKVREANTLLDQVKAGKKERAS